MILSLLAKLANRIWPIGEFAQELADELAFFPDGFVMVNSVESLIKQGHIHLRPKVNIGMLDSPFLYALRVSNIQIHLVDGEDLRVTFDTPPTERPLNWREYELLEFAVNEWLADKWDELTKSLSPEELEALVKGA